MFYHLMGVTFVCSLVLFISIPEIHASEIHFGDAGVDQVPSIVYDEATQLFSLNFPLNITGIDVIRELAYLRGGLDNVAGAVDGVSIPDLVASIDSVAQEMTELQGLFDSKFKTLLGPNDWILWYHNCSELSSCLCYPVDPCSSLQVCVMHTPSSYACRAHTWSGGVNLAPSVPVAGNITRTQQLIYGDAPLEGIAHETTNIQFGHLTEISNNKQYLYVFSKGAPTGAGSAGTIYFYEWNDLTNEYEYVDFYAFESQTLGSTNSVMKLSASMNRLVIGCKGRNTNIGGVVVLHLDTPTSVAREEVVVHSRSAAGTYFGAWLSITSDGTHMVAAMDCWGADFAVFQAIGENLDDPESPNMVETWTHTFTDLPSSTASIENFFMSDDGSKLIFVFQYTNNGFVQFWNWNPAAMNYTQSQTIFQQTPFVTGFREDRYRMHTSYDLRYLAVGIFWGAVGGQVAVYKFNDLTGVYEEDSNRFDYYDPSGSDNFGHEVHITPDGRSIVVGMPFFEDPTVPLSSSGNILMYSRASASDNDWTLIGELYPLPYLAGVDYGRKLTFKASPDHAVIVSSTVNYDGIQSNSGLVDIIRPFYFQ